MSARFTTAIAAAALAVTALAMPAATAQPTDRSGEQHLAQLDLAHDNAIEGKYVVYLHESADTNRRAIETTEFSDTVAASGIDVTHVYDALGGFAATLSDDQVETLRRDPRVAKIQQQYMVSVPSVSDADQQGDVSASAAGSWGLDRIDSRSEPLDNSYTPPNSGNGATVYVIDTGTNHHREFGNRLVHGYNAATGSRDASDCHGHGTHVAGTAAGRTVGVAPSAKIVAVKVLGCDGQGPNSDIAAGINWVARNAGPNSVANISITSSQNDGIDEASARLVRSGVLTAVGAANDNRDACTRHPAKVPEVTTVGAISKGDSRWRSSNWGRCVDIFAPGDKIRSVWKSGRYISISGTSMATPHVAGAAALYLTANPGASVRQIEAALSRGSVKGAISDVKGSPNELLNVTFIAGEPDTTPTTTPTPGPTVTDGPTPGPTTTEGPTPAPTTATPQPDGVYVDDAPQPLKDRSRISSTLNSTTAGAGKLTLSIDVDHPCSQHLSIAVITPDGVRNTLKRSRYARGNRCRAWQGVKSDTYSLRSKSDGPWRIEVSDDYAGGEGTFKGWSVKLSS